MRNILCGGTKVISHLDEKRKRFPASFPFRRKPKHQDVPIASIVPKSPVPGILLILPEVAVPASPRLIPDDALLNIPVEEPAEPPAEPAPAPVMQIEPEAQPVEALPAAPAPVDPAIVLPVDDAPAPVEAHAEDEAAVELARASYEENVKNACTVAVLSLFPDICPEYLQETSESLAYDYESVVSHILDKIDDGPSYPRRSGLKRKRQPSAAIAAGDDAAKEAANSNLDFIDDNSLDAKERADRAIRIFGSDERREKIKPSLYITTARTLLQQAYPFVPHKHVTSHLLEHRNCLLPALLDLDSHIVDKGPMGLAFVFKKTKTKLNPVYSLESLPGTIRIEESAIKKEALEEYLAALKVRQLRKAKREEEKQQEIKEAANVRQAQRDGTIKECECCYGDFPMNRMVHCNASSLHVRSRPTPNSLSFFFVYFFFRVSSSAYLANNDSGSAATARGAWPKTRSASPNTSWRACPPTAVRKAFPTSSATGFWTRRRRSPSSASSRNMSCAPPASRTSKPAPSAPLRPSTRRWRSTRSLRARTPSARPSPAGCAAKSRTFP